MSKRWLVTVDSAQVDAAVTALRDLGCDVEADGAVPVDGDVVLPVCGPEAVERRLPRVSGVKAVHPDSDVTLY